MSLRPTQPLLGGLTHPRKHPKPDRIYVPRPRLRFAPLPKIEHNNRRRKPAKQKLIVEGFNKEKPGFFRSALIDIPARTKWFTQEDPGYRYPSNLNADYLEEYGEAIVPLEMTRSAGNNLQDDKPTKQTFERMEAPLHLLLQHMTTTDPQGTQLYLAQHSLADLAAPLQQDLPTPTEFFAALKAKGDIYGSSLWMGKPPTVTPLHRDPNPNFFVQLAGKKEVRLIEPEMGKRLYERVKRQLGKRGGSARMRGEEMMQGKEKQILEELVWSKDSQDPNMHGISGFEVSLRPGDALYIPLGWWHAVRGIGKGVNASVSFTHSFVVTMLILDARSIGGSAEEITGRKYTLKVFSHSTSTRTVATDPSTQVPIDLVPGAISTSLMTRSIPTSASLSSESQSSSMISVADLRTDIQSPVSQISLHFVGLMLKCLPTIPRTVYAVLLIGTSVSNTGDVEVAR